MQNSPLDKDERLWAMLCHLLAFAGLVGIPFGNILGPLVAWLAKKDQYPLVDDQGKESLNFQISVTIYGVGLAVLAVLAVISIIGIFILLPAIVLVVGIWWVVEAVLIVMAAIKANEGERFRYPITIRFLQ
ncbi:MAG: DUF4870 domain-containing protein [Armatimonadetes bacterium]|nr:DUF4870 domain-containing protein [Armatimonadota bacterium]